jgi:hypothetical protein
MAVITQSIGSGGGRDFSTLQAWEDALPANVVTDGNSYVGEAYNDSEFTAGVDISAHTTDATHTITLTVAAGQSFQDHANVRTNVINYNVTLGAGIRRTGNYQSCVLISGVVNYLTVSRFLMQTTNTGSAQPIASTAGVGTNNNLFKDMVLRSAGNSAGMFDIMGTSTKIVNVISIKTHATAEFFRVGDTVTLIGCTGARTTNNSPGGTGYRALNYSTPVMISCACFGATTPAGTTGGSSSWSGSSKNNATDAASGLPGSSNQHSVTYSGTTPFVQASNTSTDFRAIVGTSLAGNGFLDSTNAPNDISGLARPASPTIGHWQLAVSSVFPVLPPMAEPSRITPRPVAYR